MDVFVAVGENCSPEGFAMFTASWKLSSISRGLLERATATASGIGLYEPASHPPSTASGAGLQTLAIAWSRVETPLLSLAALHTGSPGPRGPSLRRSADAPKTEVVIHC